MEKALDESSDVPRYERLWHIPIGAEIETVRELRRFVFDREHDDHDVASRRVRSQLAQDLEAVHHRHHYVEDDQRRARFAGHTQPFLPILRGEHLVRLALQLSLDEPDDMGMIVDH